MLSRLLPQHGKDPSEKNAWDWALRWVLMGESQCHASFWASPFPLSQLLWYKAEFHVSMLSDIYLSLLSERQRGWLLWTVFPQHIGNYSYICPCLAELWRNPDSSVTWKKGSPPMQLWLVICPSRQSLDPGLSSMPGWKLRGLLGPFQEN